MVAEKVREIAETIAAAGGRAVVVGGYVRDQLLQIDCKDYDIEVYGLPLATLEGLLSRHGEVLQVGRAFGVLRVKGLDIDFSLPRRDNKTGRGHRGFTSDLDPTLDFAAAARRRDLTINSIGLDPLTGELLDPHGGQQDLRDGRLRATDPAHFSEDPLRGLRVAQFAGRFEMTADAELVELCRALDLSELPGERMFEEFRKLLLKGRRPALGLSFLRDAALLRFFPELERLVGVPQDPRWHPEGDVWTHTLLAIDQAAALRQGDADDDLALMFAVLCHDLGKSEVTVSDDERTRSPAHEHAGSRLTEQLLARLRAPSELTARVCTLVREHGAPARFVDDDASPKAYRKLARRLAEGRVGLPLLVRVARADRLGRATEDARAGRFASGELFMERARAAEVADHPPSDAVGGRHLIARGLQPGPQFKALLARCREVQDETGWTDAERILECVLGDREPAADVE